VSQSRRQRVAVARDTPSARATSAREAPCAKSVAACRLAADRSDAMPQGYAIPGVLSNSATGRA
jgi:hypothetical protein